MFQTSSSTVRLVKEHRQNLEANIRFALAAILKDIRFQTLAQEISVRNALGLVLSPPIDVETVMGLVLLNRAHFKLSVYPWV